MIYLKTIIYNFSSFVFLCQYSSFRTWKY